MGRALEHIEEELLVLQCQDGDEDAFRRLIGRCHPRLFRLASRLTAEPEVARDIMQDSWLAIVSGLRRLDDPARFRSWSYLIVRNKCADWTRRRVIEKSAAGRVRDTTASVASVQSTGPEPAGEVEELRSVLLKLPEEQREVLWLHYLGEMGVAEIAGTLGVPTGTVKSRLHHARNKLRSMLERTKP